MKADVLRISKMWYFLGVALFKGELLPVEVGSNSKKISGKALPFPKKDTATIFGILTNPRDRSKKIYFSWICREDSSKFQKLWPCLFLGTVTLFANGPKISRFVDFEQQ